MKVIFLDIDGVLNDYDTKETTPEGYRGVDDLYIRNLKYVVSNTGAEIILSSDWRSEWHHNGYHGSDIMYLANKLKKYGLTIADKTPGKASGRDYSGRGEEIQKYLHDHPEITDFVIMDDNFFSDFSLPEIKDHVVLTVTEDPYGGYNTEYGLTKQVAEKAISILEGSVL